MWTPREASTRPRTWCKYCFCMFLLGGRSPMRICSQPRRHPHRNSVQIPVQFQIRGLDLMSLSVLYGCPGTSYPTCGCGLLCTWIPVSTRLLNAHCPNSLQSPSRRPLHHSHHQTPFSLLVSPHPLNSLRSLKKLKPSLSAGFRNKI